MPFKVLEALVEVRKHPKYPKTIEFSAAIAASDWSCKLFVATLPAQLYCLAVPLYPVRQ